MLNDDERIVLFLDAISKSNSRVVSHAPSLPAKDLVKLIKKLFDSGSAIKKNHDETEIIYLSDMSISPSTGIATLLINRSDKRASDPAFTNPEKNSRRVINKKFGEGQDNCAHILWKTIPKNTTEKDNYLFLMESVPGLTSAKVSIFLNHLLRKAASLNKKDFQINHPDGSLDKKGNPKQAYYYPRIQLHGHICEDFKNELKTGKLDGIEIYTESDQKTNWDSNGYTEEKRKSVHIGLTKTKILKNNWSIIKDIFNEADKNDYECAKIMFSSDQEIGRSVKLYTDNMSVVNDFKYIKKVKIEGFNKPLLSSYDQIYSPIRDKMQALI